MATLAARTRDTMPFPPRAPLRALTGPLLLGVGFGAFIDGIVLHQLLQWHHMLSNATPPNSADAIRLNVWADGLFHAGAAVATLLGVLTLWLRAKRRLLLPSHREFFGSLVLGWGVFNTLEGVVNHHLLRLHNMREVADPLPWNLGFLALGGAGLMFVGAWIIRGRFPS